MPHIHELYDYTISAFIVFEGSVLFVEHPRYNKWLPIGGHVELDEDPEEALYREVAEESGLNITVLSNKPATQSPETKFLLTPNYLDVHEANPPHKHIGFIYFCLSDSGKAILSGEHKQLAWLREADLEDPRYNLAPSLVFYAREALKQAAA